MKILIEDSISSSDSESLFKWSDVVFPKEGRGFCWEKPSRHIVARANGLAVAHIGIGEYLVCGDREVRVLGVGGVVVRPEYQGKNIPSMMFNLLYATASLNTSSNISTLFCPTRLVRYYERYGYKEYEGGVRFLQKLEYTETSLFQFLVKGDLGMTGQLSIPSNPW